jgi:hypothetical protein
MSGPPLYRCTPGGSFGAPVCPDSVPGALPSGSAPTLLLPHQNAYIRQNDPATGCPNDPFWGHGFQVTFEWTPVQGASAYRVYMKHPQASVPILDERVTTASHTFKRCTTVIGSSEGWEWRVLAIGKSDVHSEWSAPRVLNFTECRIGEVFCASETLR